MRQAVSPTYWARVYLAGPIDVAKQIIRAECLRGGLCVTVEPTTFIYKGGEEAGYVVGMVNYPKYPESQSEIIGRARGLMMKLLEGTFQHAAMLMTPDITEWVDKEGERE